LTNPTEIGSKRRPDVVHRGEHERRPEEGADDRRQPRRLADDGLADRLLGIRAHPPVVGKTPTGFANVEEDASNEAAGQTVQPWRVEDALLERGANCRAGSGSRSLSETAT
jgi:hypothetical protein